MTCKAALFAMLALSCAASMARPALAQEEDPAYSIEDVTACSHDAMRLCKDKMPNVSAIEACMRAHFNELGPKCKSRFR